MRSGTGKVFTVLWVFLAVWLAVRFLLPLFAPFLVGLLLALAAEPMAAFLTRRLHLPRSAAAGIAVTAAFAFLAMVLLLLCAFLVRELSLLSGILPELEQAARSGILHTQNWLLDLAGHMPQGIRPLISDNISALFSDGSTLLSKVIGYLLNLAGNLLSSIPDSALGLATTILSGYMICAKLPKIRRFLLHRIPRQRLRAIADTFRRLRRTLGAWLLAQGKLMGLTFTIVLLGLVLLRIPFALLWALGVCLVDAFPILGTGTILLPWSLILFLQADTPRAIGILGIYLTVTLSRSILEPKLLGRHLGLDPLAALMALYAGYRLWGVGGMLLAPLLATTAMQLVPGNTGEP